MSIRNYELVPDEELTPEYLMQDDDALDDIQEFLYGRTGLNTYDREELVSEFMEQMRVSTVNEISALRDLEYAQNLDEEGKERYAKLIDTFDRLQTENDVDKFVDYAQGIGTAPSTYIGALTGFAGKAAGTAATTAAKTGLMGLLTRAGPMAGAARAGVVEGAIGTGQEALAQSTREEVGMGYDPTAVALSGGLSAITGGALGAVAGTVGGKAAKKADDLSRVAQEQIELKRAAQKAVTESEKEKLLKLDPDLVKEGDSLLEAMNKNSPLSARLSSEAKEAVSVAVLRLGKDLERKPGQRITQDIADAILDGKITGEQFESVLKEHKLSNQEFTAAYVADISEAGRTLGKQSQLKRKLNALTEKSVLDLTDEEMNIVSNDPSLIVKSLQELDRFRLATMTSQLATTVRNALGGGFRLATDALDTAFDTSIKKLTGQGSNVSVLGDTTALTRFMTVDSKVSLVVRDMFQEEMPQEAKRLFFSAAEAESRRGSKTLLAEVGNKLNFANTVSDNIFKRAMFSASLDRQLRESGEEGMTSIVEAIRNGNFNKIDKKLIQKAVDDSLDFTYQKQPSRDTLAGRLADNIITAHREAPFLISTFIPFPRFIANQMKFVYEHSAVLPIAARAFGAPLPEKAAAKSITGTILLGSAVAWRAQQDPDTKWDEVKDEKQQIVNLAAVYGPFSPYMIMADYLVRAHRGDPIESISSYIGETAQALGTPRFRTSFGLPKIDELAEDIYSGKNTRAAGKLIGDVLGTYTIPIAMIRDANAALNKDARYVRDMDNFVPETGEPWADFFEYTMHYASKYMPQWNGVPPDERMWSATAGELVYVNPLEKQITGLTRYKPKTAFEAELARLQLPRNAFVKKDPDPIRDALNQFLIGREIPQKMESYIISDDYRNLSDVQKRDLILSKGRQFVNEMDVRETVDTYLSEVMIMEDRPNAYPYIFREAYEKLPMARRRLLNALWEDSKEYNGMSINEAGAYLWAIDANKRLGKIPE